VIGLAKGLNAGLNQKAACGNLQHQEATCGNLKHCSWVSLAWAKPWSTAPTLHSHLVKGMVTQDSCTTLQKIEKRIAVPGSVPHVSSQGVITAL